MVAIWTLGNALLGQKEKIMKVYQVINDSIVDEVFSTREKVGLRLLDIVQAAKEDSVLFDLLRVETLEVQ